MKKNVITTLLLCIISLTCAAQMAPISEQMKKYSDAVYQKQYIYYTIDNNGKVIDVQMSQTIPESVKKDILSYFACLPALQETPGTKIVNILPTEENIKKVQEQPKGIKMKDGTTLSFRPVGSISSEEEPKIGELPQKNKSKDVIQSEENRVFDVVEHMPTYPGGLNALMQFLSMNIKYPSYSEDNGVEGRILVSFVVEKDGSISSIQTISGNDPYLEKEAERVVNMMPNWIPGSTSKGSVRVKYTLPITFRLK